MNTVCEYAVEVSVLQIYIPEAAVERMMIKAEVGGMVHFIWALVLTFMC